jgi:hypothetical protein
MRGNLCKSADLADLEIELVRDLSCHLGAHSFGSGSKFRYESLFMRVRSFLLGLKLTICRFFMVIDSPVRGLRPFRGLLSRTRNVPKCTSLIELPSSIDDFIVLKKVSTISEQVLRG